MSRLVLLAASASVLFASDGLLEAIRRNDAAGIKRQLSQGASAKATDSDGVPALMLASLFGDPNAMKVLLDAGADVMRQTHPGPRR